MCGDWLDLMSSTAVSFTNRSLHSFCSVGNSELGVAHGSCNSLVSASPSSSINSVSKSSLTSSYVSSPIHCCGSPGVVCINHHCRAANVSRQAPKLFVYAFPFIMLGSEFRTYTAATYISVHFLPPACSLLQGMT